MQDWPPYWISDLLGLSRAADEIDPGQMILRALLVYVTVVVLVRLGSKRFLSKATAFDAVVAIMLGSIMSSAITGSFPYSLALAAGATIIASHWLLAFLSARVGWIGTAFKGRRRLLIEDGELAEGGLRAAKMSRKDLEQALRSEGEAADLSRIWRAYLERDGSISVLRKPPEPRTLECKVQGAVQTIRIELEP